MEPLEVLSLYPRHDGTLGSLLATRTGFDPGRPFLHFRGQTYSYGEIELQVARAAALFHVRGARPGDRIGLLARNHVATVVTFFALARLGAILCPVNPEASEDDAFYILDHAQVSGIVCSPATEAMASTLATRLAGNPWLVLTEGPSAHMASLEDALDMPGAAPPRVEVKPDTTCVLIYTSGTTGRPKGVMHCHRSVILAGEGFVGRLHFQPDERVMCVLPLFHINALFYSMVGTVAAGATLLIEEAFSASNFWKRVKEVRATEVNFVAAVPSILAKRPRSEFVPDHGLRKACIAPLSPEMHRVMREEFGVPALIDGYGMTEIPGVTITPYSGLQKVGSLGRLCKHPDTTMTFAELRVMDDDGNEVPDGVTGEFVVRTPTLMQGYYRDPEQTRASFRDGWFLTGDLGYRDADGFLWFVARKKDIIRKRGENISGAELDRVIGNHPKVLTCAAIAVPAELGEDEILAVVLLRPGEQLAAKELIAWCAENLARIKVPRYVTFVDSLPHTATHRVAKHKLRADSTLLKSAFDAARA